jgi:hypothetical protein
VSLSRIGERKDHAYVGFQSAAIDKVRNLAQPLGGYFHEEKQGADIVTIGAPLIRLGDSGDQFAAGSKNLKRAILRFASDQVDNGVRVLDLIFETLCAIVHYFVCTKRPNVLNVFWSRRRNGPQISATSELNCIGSDIPCGSKDDNCLTGFETSLARYARALVIIEEFRTTLFHENPPPMRANPAVEAFSREGRWPKADLPGGRSRGRDPL